MDKARRPLADRMRPERIEEVVGQDHLLRPGAVLNRALVSGRVFSVILWGPPGCGKTSIARLIARYSKYPFRTFSAVTSGLKELREVIDFARKSQEEAGTPTVLFVDEIHRFNKAQQDAFLPHVESGLIVLVGATTQNPSFEIIPPLLSRTRVVTLNPLGKEDIKEIVSRALRDGERGLGGSGIEVTQQAIDYIAESASGDARTALNNLEMAAHYLEGEGKGKRLLDLDTVAKLLERKVLSHDKDGEEHYNLISAFHKSLRGSDVQASIYWLYRMLMAGEDPLFIGRRMIRFAAEDVGLADPQALEIALNAFEAWQKVGPPEAELALAEAAAYLAAAPKSNALYLAEKAVKEEIERTGQEPVPLHIRNAPTGLMKRLGYSRGYLYPHNYPGGWVVQEYLPKGLKKRVFYRPTGRGFEREIRKRMLEIENRIRAAKRGQEGKEDS